MLKAKLYWADWLATLIRNSSNSGTAEFKLGGQDFTLSMHKHTRRAMFTGMFNYYTNISQKDILESPVGFQALSWFSFKYDVSFKFANTSAACPTKSGIH